MSIWAIANQKGGVGKTTTAVSLGGLLAQDGQRVLLIDLDPHGSLTSYFGFDPDNVSPNLYDLFIAEGGPGSVDVEGMPVATGVDGMSLLSASTAMATLDRRMGSRPGMGLVLSQAVARLSDAYDYMLLDCPPTLGVLMVNALVACDRLLIPVQTEFLAIKGLERMLHTLDMIERSRSRRVERLIVPTMFDRRTRASNLALRDLRNAHEAEMWRSVIPVDTHFRDASQRGLPLPQLDENARGARAYRKLLELLLSTDTGQSAGGSGR